MSAQERIAAVLREHHFQYSARSTAHQCSCGWWSILSNHIDHQTGKLVEALDLTEEWGVVDDNDFGFETPDDIAEDREDAEQVAAERCQSCDSCRNSLPKHVVSRLVTAWRPVGLGNPIPAEEQP